MKKIIMFLIFAAGIFAEDLEKTAKNSFIPEVLGGGTFSQPSKYKGGDSMLSVIGIVQYKHLYLQGSELGYKIDKNENYALVPYIKYDVTEGFNKGDLEGSTSVVDETKHPVDLGLKFTNKIKNLTLELNYFRDFTSSANNIKLKASYVMKIYEFLYFLPSISGIYNDEKYTNHYYGLSESNSSALGSQYKKLESSVKGEIELGGMMFFSSNIGTYVIYNVEILDKNNVNNLLIKNTVNNRFIFTILYRF